LCILYGHPENIVEMPSSEVLKSVADGRVDAGLVIHEARFVYPSYGLRQVVDIGDAYNARFRMPLPLGVIAAKRSLGDEVLDCLSHTLHRSICHAKTSSSLSSFVSSRATEMHSTTIWQHINHFVTRETEMMADEEFRWIQCFLEAAKGVA
jgi:1,4-dihydroxy-6-naphthoate synthase